MLLASVGTASDISVPLHCVIGIHTCTVVRSGVTHAANGKVNEAVSAWRRYRKHQAAVVVMGGRMIAYTVHAKAEHKAAIAHHASRLLAGWGLRQENCRR